MEPALPVWSAEIDTLAECETDLLRSAVPENEADFVTPVAERSPVNDGEALRSPVAEAVGPDLVRVPSEMERSPDCDDVALRSYDCERVGLDEVFDSVSVSPVAERSPVSDGDVL